MAISDHSTEQRLFRLHTPLPEDSLLVLRFHGEEALSRLFRFELELCSADAEIDALALIGKPVQLQSEVDRGEPPERFWCGYVSSFARIGQTEAIDRSDEAMTAYRMEIVPWLWFMQHHEDSRIFQNLSVPDIVEQLFEEFGYSDYEVKLQGDYAPRVYCTQYRENVFRFIGRLLEEEGIYWYFVHDGQAKRSTLVLTDHGDDHPQIHDEDNRIRYHEESFSEGMDTINVLRRGQQLRTGRVALNDYDFERPGKDLQISLDSVVHAGDNAHYEHYIHPAGYTERDQGDTIARLVLEAEEALHESLHGEGNVRLMSPGYVFDLHGHANAALNTTWQITRVRHEGRNNLGMTEAAAYHNTFSCLPQRVPYRSTRTTPRPRIVGPQTAVVTGPQGEEIYTDEYGRIKLHFFWDRRSSRNEKSSCWVRVAQMWSGRQWGSMFIPRVGHEVVVEFLEGDPDRPLVTGSVYNGDHMPAYALPEHQTRSGIKSLSSKGGEGFNELRFEDRKGEEQIFVHAQKDLDLRVLNDSRHWVGNDQHHIVGRDAVAETHRDDSRYIKRDRIAEVGRDEHLTVGGKQATEVRGSRSTKVSGAVGDSFLSHSESVSTSYYLNAGVSAVIEAGAMLTLKVGASSIVLTPASVSVIAPLVLINSGGAPGVGVPAMLVPPAGVKTAAVADDAQSGERHSEPGSAHSPLAQLRGATPPDRARSHDPDNDKPHYIEVELQDERGQVVAGEQVRIELPDGSVSTGCTDEKGRVKVTGIDPGECKISFPNLDGKAWEEA